MTAGIFNDNNCPTIGAAFKTHKFVTSKGSLTLQIWDTAGQEQFSSLSPVYYRSASLAIIFFDLTSSESFNSIHNWIDEINEKASPPIPYVLVGNKADLDNLRKVSFQDATHKAERTNSLFYAETSAKTGEGVNELFLRITEFLQNQKMPTPFERDQVSLISFSTSSCC